MDIDAIEPGVDFEEVLNQAVGRCDVLLAVIGRQWLTVTDARGRRRLDKPDDYVRMELQAALERNVRVIPVLVQGVDMPGSDELPSALKKLARRNALEVTPTRWRYDIGRLTSALERIAETGPGQQAQADAAQPGDIRPEPPSRPAASQPAGSRNLLPIILAAIIALIGIAVGAVVASGALSHGGSTHTTIFAAGAGSGSNKPNKAKPAATTTTNPAATTTTNPATTATTPATSGSLPHHCGTGIDTTASVSCALANNVFYEYYKTTQNGGNGGVLSAWSPHTKQYYDVRCSTGTEIVKCAVSGTTDPNAEIDLAQAALGIYTTQQADSYAAKADLGPNG